MGLGPIEAGTRSLLGLVLGCGLGATACTAVLVGVEEEGGGGAEGPVEGFGLKGIHRLNTAEYNATVADVLGTTRAPATANWRGGELQGFDNMAQVLGVDATQYERYFAAAEELALDVVTNEALRDRLLPCGLVDDEACLRTNLETAGLRVFRRPLSEDEIGTYSKVYWAARELGDGHYDSAGLVLRALLSSAEFLYRIEIDEDPNSTEPHPLTPYELASRLSYFLWSSAPDEKLLSLAADGTLAEEEVLARTTLEMLGDEKSKRFVANFAGQWLGARRVVDHPTAPEVYPGWSRDVAHAAADEMYLYFEEFLRTDRSWLEFLKLDVNFVNPALAAHYGMPAPPGDGLVRVEVPDDERRGFLGLAGFLAMSSMDRRTSPTLRGKWVLMNLMCTHPPDPPPGADIAELNEPGSGATANIREALELHRSEPSCANCHALFDPFGLALEQFDGIGSFRSTYPDGSVIDPSTDLQGEAFSGIDGTIDVVSSHPDFGPCVAEKMLTYALGRPLTEGDEHLLATITDTWLGGDQTPTLARAIQGLVASETFRLRRAAVDQGP